MTDRERMKHFYLTDHDFQIYVNKGCQMYRRTLDEMLISPITVEYYRSLQKGGCNERGRKGNNPKAD